MGGNGVKFRVQSLYENTMGSCKVDSYFTSNLCKWAIEYFKRKKEQEANHPLLFQDVCRLKARRRIMRVCWLEASLYK